MKPRAPSRLPGVLLAVALALGAAPREGRGEAHDLRAHYGPRDALVGRYPVLPFDAPEGATRVDVALRYDEAGGANVVDLGLLEPGSQELATSAFRGWSGGERSEIFVAVDDATPGYWPGPIPAGRWHVALGLYRVGPAGVDVEVQVRTSRGPGGPTPGPGRRPAEPIRRGAAWYAGGLHAHTVHSDGALTPGELALAARADGLDFLAITDHNNTAHQRDAIEVPGLLVIPGEEVTTPGGHLNVWGLAGFRDFVDFRVLPGDPALQGLVDAVRARGALASINHPTGECSACAWTHAVPEGIAGIEVMNRDARGLAPSLALWDVLLRQGRRITAVGASDFHRPGEGPVGAPCVRVWAEELSTRAVLQGLREGRVVVMADAGTPPPRFAVRAAGREAGVGDLLAVRSGGPLEVEVAAAGPAYAGGRVDLLWRGERVATAPLAGTLPVRFQRWANADGYLRVHLFAAGGAPLAITNPIYVALAPR